RRASSRMHSPHPALVRGAGTFALQVPLHPLAVAMGNGFQPDNCPADMAWMVAAVTNTSAAHRSRLAWREPAQMTPAWALLTDLRRRRRSLVRAGRCIQAGRDLPTALPFDLQGYRLLHLLQARARDDQSAEAARRSLPPRSQHDVHVVVRGVAMFGCEPWSDARRTGIRFQLLPRDVLELPAVEA